MTQVCSSLLYPVVYLILYYYFNHVYFCKELVFLCFFLSSNLSAVKSRGYLW